MSAQPQRSSSCSAGATHGSGNGVGAIVQLDAAHPHSPSACKNGARQSSIFFRFLLDVEPRGHYLENMTNTRRGDALVTMTIGGERSAEAAGFWATEAAERHARKLAAERSAARQLDELADLSNLVNFRL